MIGVSYFALEQFSAALEQPPHLKAIFPWSGTVDWYREVFWHGGIPTGGFATKYFPAIGMANRRNPDFYRRRFFTWLNQLLQIPALHRRLAKPHANPVSTLGRALRFPYPAHPWDDIYLDVSTEHQLYDEFWRERDMTERLGEIRIPAYLGADWENVSVHLQTPFLALERFAKDVPYRVTMAPRGTLQWPWESLHVEALAWFDHWLKGQDTGIMKGKPIRYYVEGEGAEEWREADRWPLPETRYTAFISARITFCPPRKPSSVAATISICRRASIVRPTPTRRLCHRSSAGTQGRCRSHLRSSARSRFASVRHRAPPIPIGS
jgi:putative CocE/NonD family hydrolase